MQDTPRRLVAANMHRTQSKSRPAARTSTSVIPTPSIPKGDPSLGVKLAHLPKEKRERKSNPLMQDRVASETGEEEKRGMPLAQGGVKPQLKTVIGCGNPRCQEELRPTENDE